MKERRVGRGERSKTPYIGKSYRAILSVCLPMAVQSFMLSLVSATDAVMLGFVDQTSLSAVSLAAQIQFVQSLFVLGISGGMGILLAQYWGKGDRAMIARIIPISLRANLLCGILFTAAAFAVPAFLMRLLTNDPALIAAGADYLEMAALSYFFCAVSQIYLAVLKNTGREKISSVISSTAVIINIVGNGVFIFGLFGLPAMGIRGAALATVLARVIETVWSWAETLRPGRVRVAWRRLPVFEKEISRRFWRYTLPLLGAFLVWGIAFTLYSVIMGHLGSDAVAANAITGIARNLVGCMIRGLGSGAAIIVGNLLGANSLEAARQTGNRMLVMGIVLGVLSGLILLLASPVILRFMDLTPQASRYLKAMLIICSINIVFQAFNITAIDGMFCAGGDSRFDMESNVCAMWCFSVPLGFLAAFVFKWPVIAVYALISLDEIVKIPAIIRHYLRYKWVRNLTVPDDKKEI